MGNQLRVHYGDAVHSEDLAWLALKTEPDRVDTIPVNGRDYEASYFGGEDISSYSPEYIYREFWRLEHAYDDFKDRPKTGNLLPYSEYPMPVEAGQVFTIDYTKEDGSVVRMYYRSDEDALWDDSPATVGFFD
jgi:hypothetical protein